MAISTTRFETASASKYLQQLCKHFEKKITVEHTETEGSCSFDFGSARLSADPRGLDIEAVAENDELLDRTKSVIESHLLRFAFREEPKPLAWS